MLNRPHIRTGMLAALSLALLAGCSDMPGETHAKPPAASHAVQSNTPVYPGGPALVTAVDREDAEFGTYLKHLGR